MQNSISQRAAKILLSKNPAARAEQVKCIAVRENLGRIYTLEILEYYNCSANHKTTKERPNSCISKMDTGLTKHWSPSE